MVCSTVLVFLGSFGAALVGPIDLNLLMRCCSSLYDFNLLKLSAAFPFSLIARKSPARPHINPHPFSTLPFCSRPRRRLGAWLGDNCVIPLESPALSRQFHYNARLGSLCRFEQAQTLRDPPQRVQRRGGGSHQRASGSVRWGGGYVSPPTDPSIGQCHSD